MIDQIISALRISLAECKKYEEPAEYIYQINQVLNRYKSNLFKLIPDKHKLAYDPKELFNIQIKGSWRCQPDYKRRTAIFDRSPLLLHVVGFMPEIGRRLNLEKNLSKAVRIDDIVDIDRINGLKTDYYKGMSPVSNSEHQDEDDLMEEVIGWEKAQDCSMYWNADKVVDEVVVITFQLNGKVFESVLEDHHFASAASMKIKGDTPRQQAIQDALEQKLLNKGKNGHYAEIHEEDKTPDEVKEDIVRDFFSPVPPQVQAQAASLSYKTDKPKKRKTGAQHLTRKKHNFW